LSFHASIDETSDTETEMVAVLPLQMVEPEPMVADGKGFTVTVADVDPERDELEQSGEPLVKAMLCNVYPVVAFSVEVVKVKPPFPVPVSVLELEPSR